MTWTKAQLHELREMRLDGMPWQSMGLVMGRSPQAGEQAAREAGELIGEVPAPRRRSFDVQLGVDALCDGVISIEQAGRVAGMHPHAFSKAVRRIYGEPPKDIRRRARVQRIVDLLRAGHSLSSAASVLGVSRRSAGRSLNAEGWTYSRGRWQRGAA